MPTNEQLIQDIARPLYQDHGPNQWPHIQRVVSTAKDMATKANRRIDDATLAALYLHDAAKSRMQDYPTVKDHGVASAILARAVLKGKLPNRTIATAANAIAEHNMDVPPRSLASDTLMSADANIPDLEFLARKSYLWSKRNGLKGNALLDNVLNSVKNRTVASGRKHVPTLYSTVYAPEIAQLQRRAAATRREDIRGIIRNAMAKYKDMDPYA